MKDGRDNTQALTRWGFGDDFGRQYEALLASRLSNGPDGPSGSGTPPDAAQRPPLVPARVLTRRGDRYDVVTAAGPRAATSSGALRHQAAASDDLPAVGDWVAVLDRGADQLASLVHRFDRRTAFVRSAPISGKPQVVAANVDAVLIVCSLNADFNLRRIERYLVAIWHSGAEPVVVLSKADLAEDAARAAQQVREIAPGVRVHIVSALSEPGLSALHPELKAGRTLALVGSSGVGKSTILNGLMGAACQVVSEIREDDDRGRHTTTHRELFELPSGALIVDTPGMRELQLWGGDSGVSAVFTDVEALAESCRFRNCAHGDEPDCAIQSALSDGTLDAKRLRSYRKLRREEDHQRQKQDQALALDAKRRHKAHTKRCRARTKSLP